MHLLLNALFLLPLLSMISADHPGKYAIIKAENKSHSLTICFIYFPFFHKLANDLKDSERWPLVHLDVESVCNKTITADVTNKLVMIDDRHCGNLEKTYYMQKLNAKGVLIVQSTDNSDPVTSKNVTDDDVNIILGMITQDDKTALLDLGSNTSAQLYAIDNPKYDYSFFIIWILAVFATVTGSFWSGIERYQAYQSIAEASNAEQSEDDEAEPTDDSPKQRLTNKNTYRALNVSVPVVFGLVVGACTTLVLLYFFFEYVVKVLIVLFLIFLALTFATLLQFFLHKIPALTRRFRYRKLSVTLGEILSIIFAASIAIWFYFVRHQSYAWVLQDMFGISLIIVALKEIRMPSLKIITLLLVLLFLYDIFFVFITPLFTPTGESIMVSVALGANGEELPITLKVPRFNPTSVKHCNLYSLLGFGDMLAPGLLLSYCHGFDLENQLKRFYFILSSIFYGLGLLAAFFALSLMEAAQPALLYLVPFTIIPVICASVYRKEFKPLWQGVSQMESQELPSQPANEQDSATNLVYTSS